MSKNKSDKASWNIRSMFLKTNVCLTVAIFALLWLMGDAVAQQMGLAGIRQLPSTLYLDRSVIETLGENPPKEAVPWAVSAGGLAEIGELRKGMKDEPFLNPETSAEALLSKAAENLGISDSPTRMVVRRVKRSLSGTYVQFEQTLNGLPIKDKVIVVSFTLQGGIQSVFRNIVEVPDVEPLTFKNIAEISEDDALKIVWNDLSASGEFLEMPGISKVYVNENNVLTLAYVVQIAVSEPFGYWEHWIDATTGRIIRRADRSVHGWMGKRSDMDGVDSLIGEKKESSVSADFGLALERFNRTQAETRERQAQHKARATPANTFGLVFDPDPISVTGDLMLKDDSPPKAFNEAYSRVELRDITKRDGEFHLWGDLVRIEDFEAGDNGRRLAPSTAKSEWNARRGNNAFNDVMTFYFLHNSMKYLQKLGYTGALDLFPDGISADSDGVDGEDNSYYIPGSDRLAFGHGCVDDNEDADVILHEFAHAITYHINENWGGGDAYAIGEGFGDYWAFSYRLRNGMLNKALKGKVFVWDGIDSCWEGRRIDQSHATYDENRRYFAHKDLGTFISDELWSTPLAQSLIELFQSGESPDSVDKIILEGMFGVGSNFTMRQLALETVQRAKILYPRGLHSTVFLKHFTKHKILPEQEATDADRDNTPR